MARTIALWVSGIITFCIIGGGIGDHIEEYGGAFWGIIAGASAFTCLRLWLTEQNPQPSN